MMVRKNRKTPENAGEQVKKEEAEMKPNGDNAQFTEPSIDKENFSDSPEVNAALEMAEEYKRKWYSVTAEYENFRKRNSAAVTNAYRDGAADTVLKLLPVADNFGYAYDLAQDDKTKEGIDKVMKSFATILQGIGIEEIVINPGDPFDESVAEAIMNYPCEEGEEPNTVRLVLKKGYRSGEKVIRYAQVAVTV